MGKSLWIPEHTVDSGDNSDLSLNVGGGAEMMRGSANANADFLTSFKFRFHTFTSQHFPPYVPSFTLRFPRKLLRLLINLRFRQHAFFNQQGFDRRDPALIVAEF